MLPKTIGALSAVILSLMAFDISTSAATSEVELTFHNQDIAIKGRFAGFTDDAYVIRTDTGVLHVPATLVQCGGPICGQISEDIPAG